MTKRYGPTRGAGTVIEEQQGQQTLTPGALGVTAYTGICKKGPIGKPFRNKTRSEFLFKAGGSILSSQLPDTALSFFKVSKGAGELWVNRITDGSEKKAELAVYNRNNSGAQVAKFIAGNGGRWAGKKQKIVDEYDSFTANTVTLSNIPAGLKKDELVGALVKFKAIPGKSYKVEANSDAGVLTFASDVNLIDDLNGTTLELLEVDLQNDGENLAVLIKNGLLNPSTEFGVEIYLIEGNTASLKKNYTDLSLDPQSPKYYVDVINSDSDSEFLLKAENLNLAGSLLAAQRPSNYAGISKTLTSTVLTADIHYLSISSVANAKAALSPVTLGSEVIKDELTLTNLVAGVRAQGNLTFTGQPANTETVTIGADVYTFKTVPVGALDVLIGADAEASITNLVAKVNAQLDKAYFAKKQSAAIFRVYAKNAGVAGNAIATTTTIAVNATWGGAVLSGGVAQTWSLESAKQPHLGTVTGISTGIAFAAVNDFGFGFTIQDTTVDDAKMFAPGDTLSVFVEPFENVVGGYVYPKDSDVRTKFLIISNTANSITVKPGSTMTVGAAVGDIFRLEYMQALAGGYDGIAEIDDANYEDAYDTSSSPLKVLRGKNLGLVKLATPGITSSVVQKAGVAFAASQNWQYRYEVPSNISDEVAIEEYINATIGRNDYAVVLVPSYIKVSKNGGGTKLISATGHIHGREARMAADYQGYHKAAAGEEAILDGALGFPDGFENREPLDEEFLNPLGIGVLKMVNGNIIIWGDRTVGVDSSTKFKHKREYLSHVENVFLENFNFVIFALNNAQTDQKLKPAFIRYFQPELAKGAIVGTSLQDAIRLKIDSEINTTATRADGDLFAELSLAIVDTVERFTIRIGQQGVTEDVA